MKEYTVYYLDSFDSHKQKLIKAESEAEARSIIETKYLANAIFKIVEL